MTLVPSLGSLLLPGRIGIPAVLKAAVSGALKTKSLEVMA
jgi:hypothetical protein